MSPHTHPALLCFSHLRWHFVYQRPQHLMSRASRHREVLFIEEPVFEENPGANQMRVQRQRCGTTVVTPLLRAGASEEEQIDAQRSIVDRIVGGLDVRRGFSSWYYTPMALRFTAHLHPAACVYDCMD